MASFKKRFKKIVRTIHKYEGRVLKVAAPIVGAVFAGPLGAAAGTALGSGASYYGEKQGALAKGRKGKAVKKAGKRGLKSGLIIGGIVTGGAAIAALAGGTGVAGSLIPGLVSKATPALNRDARNFGPLPDQGADPGGEAPRGMSSFDSSSPAGSRIYSDPETSLSRITGSAGKPFDYSGVLTSVLGAGAKVLERTGKGMDEGWDPTNGAGKSEAGMLGGLGDFLNPTNPDGSTDWLKIALIGGGVLLIVSQAKAA